MNVVVICSDTFRYDHLGFTGNSKILTPNLDTLARESASFENFLTGSFPTILNRIEVFSGRSTFPFYDWGAQPLHYPVLPEVFKRHGFSTALIADNPHLMKEHFGFGRGFDFVKKVPGQMDDPFQPETAPMIEPPCPLEKLDSRAGRMDNYRRNAHWYRQQGISTTEKIFRETIDWLNRPPEKFFLWIDAFDPHEPWDAPASFREKYPWNPKGDNVVWPRSGKADYYSDADLENIRTLYKAEVTQTDFWIGKLIQHLREKNLLDQTLLVFCSDHGFYLGEHGLLGKLFNHKTLRPTTIYKELGHIPLLIRHPQGLAAGKRIDGLCQPLDLFPTLLELAGIPQVDWTQGHSLVPRLQNQSDKQNFIVAGSFPRRKHVSCTTVWTDEWCFVYTPYEGLNGSELYHRPTDPAQTTNVIAANPDVAQKHFAILKSWLEQLKVPKAQQRQLLFNSDFGYWDRVKSYFRARYRKFFQRCFHAIHFANYAKAPTQRD